MSDVSRNFTGQEKGAISKNSQFSDNLGLDYLTPFVMEIAGESDEQSLPLVLEPKALKPGGAGLTVDERRIEQQRMTENSTYVGRSPTAEGPSLKGVTGLGNRIGMMHAKNLVAAILQISKSTVRLQSQISEYNDSARATDPGLFSDAADMAVKMNKAQPGRKNHVTADQIIQRALDPAERDPAIMALQERIMTLIRKPNFREMRAEIHGIATTLASSLRDTPSIMKMMKGGNANALEKVAAALEDTLEKHVERIPPLFTGRSNSFQAILDKSKIDFLAGLREVTHDLGQPIAKSIIG